MFTKTHTHVGEKTFEGQNGAPLLAASVGIGYLKEPLRYLTQNDIKNMTLRSGASGEEKRIMSPLKKGANRNLIYQTISKLALHNL